MMWQNFSTPYFNNLEIGLSVAYAVSPMISMGFSLRGLNTFFDFDKFDLIDPDPLFLDKSKQWKKWDISLGTGFLFSPHQNFLFGMSFNHLNRPDISLGNDGIRKPIELDFGAKYHLGKWGTSAFAHYISKELAIGFHLERELSDKGKIKIGSYDQSLMVEGLLNIVKKVSLIYRLEYPFNDMNHFSYGSHLFGMSWNINPPGGHFGIEASVDTVKFVRKRSILRIDKMLTDHLESFFSYMDYADFIIPANDPQSMKDASLSTLMDDPEVTLNEEKYENYRENLKSLFSQSSMKNKTIDIHYQDNESAERVLRVKNYLQNELGLPGDDIRIYQDLASHEADRSDAAKIDSLKQLINQNLKEDGLEFLEITNPWIENVIPENISFHISNKTEKKVYEWKIIITDASKKPVHLISGFHQLPDLIEWNGLTADGKSMPVGHYYYHLRYSDQPNHWLPEKPKYRRLVFIDVIQEALVEFTSKNITDVEGSKISIIMKNAK